MLDKPEARARLRRKLEQWPEGRGNPVNVNEGLWLLAMVESLQKEADWLAEKLLFHTGRKTLRGWREAARRAVEAEHGHAH